MNRQLLFSLVVILLNCQEPCIPEYILSNVMKDSVTLDYFDPNQNTYPYLFIAAMLSGQVRIALYSAISEIEIEQVFGSINYYLDADITGNKVLFKFNTPNNKWRTVSVHFLLTSRNDLFVTRHVISNVRSQQRIHNIPFNSSLTLTYNLNHVTFIVGLFCNYTNNIELSVVEGEITPTNAVLFINAGSTTFITNITIVSIIYSTSQAQFTSISADLTYKSFQSQYYNIFKTFLPIYYYLLGLSSISLTQFHRKTFSYKFQLINLSVINATAINTFKNIIISYIAISAFTSKICCGNLYSQDECIDQCFNDAYPMTYSDGGKACIKCDPVLGLKINQLSTSCSCLPNYELLTEHQCTPIKSQNLTCKGINQIVGTTGCICSPGTVNISGVCSSCASNQVIENGQCVAKTLEIICKVNEILQNGLCICNSNSIDSGNGCVLCSEKTFADKPKNLCSPCVDNCLKCINNATCLQCIPGYSFDLSVLKCFNSNESMANKATVNTLFGFPKYTTRAIIFDFQITNANYTLKSASQLRRNIKIAFSSDDFAPRSIQYIQNPNKHSHIRLLLNYYQLYPTSQFRVTILFADAIIGLKDQKSFSLNYSTNDLAYQIL